MNKAVAELGVNAVISTENVTVKVTNYVAG
jgi:hypothetical protein